MDVRHQLLFEFLTVRANYPTVPYRSLLKNTQ